jgi:hypothetical protein
MYPNPSIQITGMTISPGDSMSASVTYNSSSGFTLQMTDNTNKTDVPFSITQTSTTAQRSSAEWIVEAPSSFFGILPLANFGTATFTQAQATINGTTGAIDNTSWQNTAINMVNRSGTVIASTSGLTDSGTPPTSSFSVTFTGSSGGGGHHHGHGPMETVELAGPVPANGQAQPNTMVSALPADLFVPQIQQRDLASGLKTWRST